MIRCRARVEKAGPDRLRVTMIEGKATPEFRRALAGVKRTLLEFPGEVEFEFDPSRKRRGRA